MEFGRHRGTVIEFDADVGLGVVTADGSAGSGWSFHCTQLTDGTRTIGVGAVVSFDVRPVGPGRWEATSVTAV